MTILAPALHMVSDQLACGLQPTGVCSPTNLSLDAVTAPSPQITPLDPYLWTPGPLFLDLWTLPSGLLDPSSWTFGPLPLDPWTHPPGLLDPYPRTPWPLNPYSLTANLKEQPLAYGLWQADRLTKWAPSLPLPAGAETAVNIEWGAFDCEALPRCAEDQDVDEATVHKGEGHGGAAKVWMYGKEDCKVGNLECDRHMDAAAVHQGALSAQVVKQLRLVGHHSLCPCSGHDTDARLNAALGAR
eukprot:93895-Chlamydomonas_euryale.AAC.2